MRSIRFCSQLFVLVASLSATALADQVGVRIRFGVGDTQVADWDGSVELSEGKMLSLDGWRFQNPDKVDRDQRARA